MGQLLGRLKSKGLCTICLEKMSVKDIFALHCGHLFHSQCIESWLIERETCPVCRKPSKLDDGVPSPHFDDDTSDRRSEISDTHSDDDSSGESESESERVDNCDDLRRQLENTCSELKNERALHEQTKEFLDKVQCEKLELIRIIQAMVENDD